MRVLFAVPRSFNPKQTYREYPLGVGFLGTLLKQAAGHDVSIFDQNAEAVDDMAFLQLVAEFQPALVGFSVITPNYPVARKQIQALKSHYPQVRVVAGGIHATLFAQDLIADGAEVVVLGEGDASIIELVTRLESGADLADMRGLVFRNRKGGVIRTPGLAPNASLAALPVVDRALYNLPRYTHHSMLASRGCPHHCAFCCNYTGTLRNDSVMVRWHEEVLAEMELLRDKFGAREIFFADDLFLLRKRDILAFCQAAIARRLGVGWIAQLRADQVDSRIAEAMRAAGCQRIYFGVEAGSDTILARAKKGMTMAQIMRGVQAAKAAGLRVKTGWIYGLPGSLEEQYASIPFMLALRPHEISIHQLIPFPGTDYYQNPGHFGIRIADSKAFESFCYGGLEGNIRFDYLSQSQFLKLLDDTVSALESAGFVGSDQALPGSEFVYTTPLSKTSMRVFRPTDSTVQSLSA